MTIAVTDSTTLLRIRFTQDADPDFNGSLVVEAAEWAGLGPLQKALRLAAVYNAWAADRAPRDPAVVLAIKRIGLVNSARQRWELERDLGLVAVVDPDGGVTLNPAP